MPFTLQEHLKTRNLNLALYQHISIDETERSVVFYLYNLSNKIVGYQTYRPDADKEKRNDEYGRYYTYRMAEGDENGHRDARRALAVWGLESFYFRSDVLFITEGIFDSAMFHNAGLPAIAILSCGLHCVKSWFAVLMHTRKLYFVEDGDGKSKFGMYQKYGTLIMPPAPFKDTNEMPVDVFNKWILENDYSSSELCSPGTQRPEA